MPGGVYRRDKSPRTPRNAQSITATNMTIQTQPRREAFHLINIFMNYAISELNQISNILDSLTVEDWISLEENLDDTPDSARYKASLERKIARLKKERLKTGKRRMFKSRQ